MSFRRGRQTVCPCVAMEILGHRQGSITMDVSTHVVVRGDLKYYEIQFGHRVYFVKTSDVVLKRVS